MSHWRGGVGLGTRGSPRAEEMELTTRMSEERLQWCCHKCKHEIPDKIIAQYSQNYCVFQARQSCVLHKVVLL